MYKFKATAATATPGCCCDIRATASRIYVVYVDLTHVHLSDLEDQTTEEHILCDIALQIVRITIYIIPRGRLFTA